MYQQSGYYFLLQAKYYPDLWFINADIRWRLKSEQVRNGA